MRCPAALIFDHATGACTLVRETPECADYDAVLEDVAALRRQERRPSKMIGSVVEELPERYRDAVVRAKEFIAEGDIYQANLSRQWHASVTAELESSDIYEALCRRDPLQEPVRARKTNILTTACQRSCSRIRRSAPST